MSKKSLIVIALVVIMATCCSMVCALDYSPPATGTKLRITNSTNPDRVLNVSTWGTPAQSDNVTIWSWSDNGTQWWKTEYYAQIGGVGAYMVPLYSYPTLMLNYHQYDNTCTIYGTSGNYYTDYTIYWDNLGSYLFQLYLYSYNRFLGIPDDDLGEQCSWYSMPYGTTNQEKWIVTTLT